MIARAVATVLGLGYLRPAPGTWASAAAVAAGVWLHATGGFWLLALATAAATWAGFAACAAWLPGKADQDPDEVVIDEVAGQWLALCFPAAAFLIGPGEPAWLPSQAWVAAFLLFRLFDIRKPWLVGRADRTGGVRGVMLDDLWAGLFAGFGVIVLGVLWHVVMFR
jgi:phosphatidylglycerophosphatase A